jgi:hypothetical protein
MESLPVKQVTWPQVILLLGLTTALVGGVTLLALNDKSVTDILTVVVLVVVPILGGLGIQFTNAVSHKLDKVQETANGRLTEVMDDNKQLHEENKRLQAQVAAHAIKSAPPDNHGPPIADTPSRTPGPLTSRGWIACGRSCSRRATRTTGSRLPAWR